VELERKASAQNEEIFELTRKYAELEQIEKELEDAHEKSNKANLDIISRLKGAEADKSDHIVTLESSETSLRHELELLKTCFEECTRSYSKKITMLEKKNADKEEEIKCWMKSEEDSLRLIEDLKLKHEEEKVEKDLHAKNLSAAEVKLEAMKIDKDVLISELNEMKSDLDSKVEEFKNKRESLECSSVELERKASAQNEEIFELTRKYAELEQIEKELEDAHEKSNKANLDIISRLKGAETELLTEFANLQDEHEDLKAENSQLREDLACKHKELTEVRKSEADAEQKLIDVNAKCDMEQSLRAAELNDKIDHIVMLQSSETSLRHELELLQTYFEDNTESSSEKINMLEKKNVAKEEEIKCWMKSEADLLRLIEDLKLKHEEEKVEKDLHAKCLSAAEVEIEILKNDKSMLISEMNVMKSDLDSKVEEFKKKYEFLECSNLELERKVSVQNKIIVNNNAQFIDDDNAMSDLRNTAETMKCNLLKVSEEMLEKDLIITSLRESKNVMRLELEEVNTIFGNTSQTYLDKIDSLGKNLEDKCGSEVVLQLAINELNEKISLSNAVKDTLRKELDDLKQCNEILREEKDKIAIENETYANACEQDKLKISSLELSHFSLEQKFQDLEDKFINASMESESKLKSLETEVNDLSYKLMVEKTAKK